MQAHIESLVVAADADQARDQDESQPQGEDMAPPRFIDVGILCLTYAEHTRLTRILNEIFSEDPTIENLKANITFDKIASNGSIDCHGKLSFVDPGHPDNNNNGIVTSSGYEHSAIRFVEFTPRDLSVRTLYNGSENRSTFWSNVYNTSFDERYASRRYGINVLKRINIKGYILNFNDIRKLMEEANTNRRYDKILDYVNEFYYFSKRNCLLGLTTSNGVLLLRLQAIQKILKYNEDDEVVKRCLHNVFVCFNKVLDRFINLNVREVGEEVEELVTQSVMNRVINGSNFSRRFYRYADADGDIESLKETINDYIKTTLKNAFRGSVFGVNDRYSYSDIVNNIIRSRRDKEKKLFKDGFAKGMQIGMKFEMMGWSPANPKFADSSDTTCMWWEKEVNIKPDSFVKDGVRYLIPETERTYHITKLYINQNGSMRADGKHPNLSGSRVCIGDLHVEYSDDTAAIQETLVRVEELLDMINYDSAYDSEKLNHLLEVSEAQDALFSTGGDSIKERVRKASSIRELDGNFDDDDEEVEEELTPEEEAQLFHIADNNGDHIAELTCFPVPEEETTSDRYNHRISRNINVDSVSVESLESAPVRNNTYETEETIIVNDINTVDEAGEQRPIIFNMGEGQTPVDEVFSFGDDILVGGDNAE